MKVGTDGVLLGAWADVQNARHILDLGCGCGLISIMAAQRNQEAQIMGIEIDQDAVLDARSNVESSPFSQQILIACEDIMHFEAPEQQFDCIISNPPYYEEDLLPPSATRATARHTQGGGLTFPALLRAVDHLLSEDDPNARFSVILPTQAISRFILLANLHRLHLTRQTLVFTKPQKPSKRTLLEFRRQPSTLKADKLILINDQGQRSDAYNALCQDFYLPQK